MPEVRLMVSRHSAFYSPLIATIAGGFLEKEGLSGTYAVVPKGSGTPAEVDAGRVEVGQAAVASSWGRWIAARSRPWAHFAQINRCDGFFVASREPDSSFTWDKLRGGRFMYVHGGQPEIMLRYGLHKMGVDLSDVPDISKPSTPEMMDAFRNGEGGYFHEQGAYPQQLAHEGVAHVVASVGEAVGPVAFSSLVARRDWLSTDDARRFTAAYTAARRWVHTADPVEVARAEADFFPDMALEAVSEAIRTYQRLDAWSGEIPIEPALYEAALDVFEHSGRSGPRHPYGRVVVPPPHI